jgi:hypothetical protein
VLLVALPAKIRFGILILAAMVVSELKGINVMTTLKTAEEVILTFDVSDEALEIAGMVSGTTNFTFGVCTFEQPGCPPSIEPEPLR